MLWETCQQMPREEVNFSSHSTCQPEALDYLLHHSMSCRNTSLSPYATSGILLFDTNDAHALRVEVTGPLGTRHGLDSTVLKPLPQPAIT